MSGTGAPQAMADLAARYGLVTPDSRKRIQEQLRSGVAAGQPTSLTRILIAEGQAPEVMAAILASGEHASAVLCDCCSAPISQHQIHERLEVPCPSCGSLLMGFRVFAKPPTARRKSASTARYGEVLPVPAGKSVTERVGAALPAGTREEENSETSPYGIVLLPTPLLERAFGDLLATDTSTKGAQKPPPAPDDPGFASAEELEELATVDPDEDGEETVDADAVEKLRQETGTRPGESFFEAPKGEPPPPKRSLWPLVLLLLLLLGISSVGAFVLLRGRL